VTTPAGVHLEAKKHGVKGILKALRDVMKALKFSHEHHIYHRDVSYLNIVYKNQRGYLIDWGVASNTSDLVNAPLTGTYLFSSLPVCLSTYYLCNDICNFIPFQI
jgi:serine/threonine protein kinase